MLVDDDMDEVLEAYLCGDVTNLKESRRGKAERKVSFTYKDKKYGGYITFMPTEEKDSEGAWKIYYHAVENSYLKEIK